MAQNRIVAVRVCAVLRIVPRAPDAVNWAVSGVFLCHIIKNGANAKMDELHYFHMGELRVIFSLNE